MVGGIHYFAPSLTDGFWPGVLVEFNGMLLDIIVFGLLIAAFARSTERRREIKRQSEIIDDFKKWNSDEARYRIGGAIRRLNRLGKFDIDFGGVELFEFSFARQDIKDIKGSVFYDGTWGRAGSRDRVVLQNVDFSYVDCRDVTFSKFHPLSGLTLSSAFAEIRDCSFRDSDLRGATFRGAHMEWTNEHPSELGIWHDFEDGTGDFEQTHYPPFWRTRLKGASFAEVTFKNADFREAEGILDCDFLKARGLDTCLFGDEETKKAVIAKAENIPED
jgi:uncharacterized protein YjbI with pentapeptide repeats